MYMAMYFQDFQPPKRPFKRMDYKDAIEYLRANNIKKEDDTFYEFGDVCITRPIREYKKWVLY